MARNGQSDHVVPSDLERKDEPDRDEARFGSDDTAMVLGPQLADKVKQEVADWDTKSTANDGRDVEEGELVVG